MAGEEVGFGEEALEGEVVCEHGLVVFVVWVVWGLGGCEGGWRGVCLGGGFGGL